MVAAASLNVRAQSPTEQPEHLTLHRAVQVALENHPSLRLADANLRSTSDAVTQVKGGYFPSVSATATASRTDGAFVFNPSFPARLQTYNNYSTALQIQQLIFDFGRTSGRVSANENLAGASMSDFEATRENVIVNVQLSYFGLLQAGRVEKVNDEAVGLAAAHLVQAKAFYTVGRRPQFDVTKAEVDLANARVNQILARGQSHLAAVQLENALGVHPPAGYALVDTFDIAPFSLSLDSARAVAMNNRPDLRAAEARVSANRDLVTAAKGQHFPTLSAFGNWTWSGFDFPLSSRWNAGVTMSLPIFQGFSLVAQVNQAEANADAAEAGLDLLKEATTLDVQQNYWGMKEAEERIAAASRLLEQAEQNLVLAEKQYAAGVGTAIEVADAQGSLSNARIARIQALYDYDTSVIYLRRSMGVVPEP
jgi:TolC family type I secretion outer membrane protein